MASTSVSVRRVFTLPDTRPATGVYP
jgi:hypothetical protein